MDSAHHTAETSEGRVSGLSVDDFLQLQSRILDSMSEGVTVSDEAGYILYTNPAEDCMFGYEPGEMIGMHVSAQNAYPPEENGRRVAETIEQLQTVGRWEGEWLNKRKDGSTFYTRARITASDFKSRKYWVCVQEDISERRQTEQAALHLAAIVASSTDAIVSKDLNGIVTSWNKSAERVFGYTSEEMVGGPIARIAAPDRLDEMPRILARIRSGERLEHYETFRRRKDGRIIAVSLTVSPVRNAAGEIIGASKIARDITEERRIRQSLAERERELRTLVANLPDIVSRAGPDLRFLFVSPAVERLTGIAPEEFIGKTHEEMGFSAEVCDAAAGAIRRVLETGSAADVQFGYDSPRLGVRRLHGVAAPEQDGDGRIVSVVSIVRDVTDIHRSEQAQKAAERELMLLVEASGRLLATPHSREVLKTIIELGQRFVAADAYAVWRQASDGVWRTLASAGLSAEYVANSVAGAGDAASAPLEPMIFEDVETDERLRFRCDSLRTEGIRSMMAIPLRIEGQFAGTITFYWREKHAVPPAEVRISTALANLAAAALGTAELYERQTASKERAERSERRSAFLAEAGAVLSSSLDYQTTLANVARLSVPVFADWCSVDVLDEGGAVKRVATHHSDPAKVEFAARLRKKYPAREDDAAIVALRTGKPVLVEQVPPDLVRQSAQDPEHADRLAELGLQSVISAPMVIGMESLGVLTFVTAESGRRYTNADLQLAQELARRAAAAVAHARLYRDLKENEQRLRLAVEAAGLGVWEHDLRAAALSCSEQCKRNVGADPDAPLSYEDLSSRVHDDDREAWRAASKRARDERTAFESEYRVRFPDGAYHWVLAYGRCVYDDAGEPLKMIGVTMDITERKRIEEALRRSNEDLRRANDDLNQFAYSASHDLQEPLRMVAIYSQLLARAYPDALDATAREYIDFLLQGARRMERLIKDLLEYTRAVNITDESVAPVDTGLVLDQALANLGAAVDENGAVIDREPLPRVRVKDIHLLQLFQNLIGNAIKYRKPGEAPRVRVSSEPAGPMVKFAIADNGIGIPADYRTQVFGIFKRLHTNDKYSGTGIGLAICQRIVERYDGRIWVDSEEGVGSTFYFTLPR